MPFLRRWYGMVLYLVLNTGASGIKKIVFEIKFRKLKESLFFLNKQTKQTQRVKKEK
jgi:hypothetical protein